jgi:hypothetical protein
LSLKVCGEGKGHEARRGLDVPDDERSDTAAIASAVRLELP